MNEYECKDVVCDYGIFENGELKLILNSRTIALQIKQLLEEDARKHRELNPIAYPPYLDRPKPKHDTNRKTDITIHEIPAAWIYKDYINIPMQENDATANTIGEYLERLLLTLWDEEEGFSGKRPFGNSGWKYEVYTALIHAKVVNGKLDEYGDIEKVDYSAADIVVREIISEVFNATKGGRGE